MGLTASPPADVLKPIIQPQPWHIVGAAYCTSHYHQPGQVMPRWKHLQQAPFP